MSDVKPYSRLTVSIAATMLGLILSAAVIGTFAMAREFSSLETTVRNLVDRVDSLQERIRYLERLQRSENFPADMLGAYVYKEEDK